MNTYTLYWLTGKRETVQGNDPARAMTLAGYGGGAVRTLDFYANGDNHDYEWNAEKRDWMRVAPNAQVTGVPALSARPVD